MSKRAPAHRPARAPRQADTRRREDSADLCEAQRRELSQLLYHLNQLKNSFNGQPRETFSVIKARILSTCIERYERSLELSYERNAPWLLAVRVRGERGGVHVRVAHLTDAAAAVVVRRCGLAQWAREKAG